MKIVKVILDNTDDMEYVREDIKRFNLIEEFKDLGFSIKCEDDTIIFTGEKNLPFEIWDDTLSINGWDLMVSVKKVEIEL
jgi:hypothetical protein